MNICIVKYNAGNIRSVTYALNRLGIEPELTDDPEKLNKADKVIFPGVGEASTAMSYLKQRELDKVIKNLTQPVLGICLGLQLMCSYSEENDTECIGIFDEIVKKFPPDEKVPHMGWNVINGFEGPLFKGLEKDEYMYFVHSYYAGLGNDTFARTNYIIDFSSGLHKDNFYALQFHPEKSGRIGAKILENFVNSI